MWVEKQSSAQSSFKKLNINNGSQKKTLFNTFRYYTFQVLSNFTVFLYFVQNILPRIVKQSFGCNLAQSPSNLNFWTFSVTLKHFSVHDKNINIVLNGVLAPSFFKAPTP